MCSVSTIVQHITGSCDDARSCSVQFYSPVFFLHGIHSFVHSFIRSLIREITTFIQRLLVIQNPQTSIVFTQRLLAISLFSE